MKTSPLRYRWLVFLLLALGYVLVYFHRLAPAVVAVDMMRDLSADGTLLGLLGAAYFYPYALMQLPAGLLADSWGPRKTVTAFFLVAAGGAGLLGCAASAEAAIAGRALVGLGVAMLFVPTLKILSHWFRREEFARMTGLLIAMGGIGTLSATTPLAWLSSATDWRFSFLLIGGVTLLLSLLIWRFVSDRPEERGFEPLVADQAAETALPLGQGVRRVLATPAFWMLGLWFFFTCAVFFSYAGLWGGPYLMQVYRLSRESAGHVLSMMAFGMIAGSFLLSWLSERLFRGRKPLLIIAGGISLGITGVFALFTSRLSLPALYLLTFGLGVCNNAIVVIGFTMSKELFPVRMAGTATGLVNFFPFAAGAVFQPLLGYILEKAGKVGNEYTATGYRRMFLVLGASAALALLFSLFVRETAVHKKA